jgi:hypothetical protein
MSGVFDPTRRSVDNPPFSWPQKTYHNISGEVETVQRGYMRGLLPTSELFEGLNEKADKKLFFQFNPQVLVRSVQQSIGALNPLLQPAEQLMQPIPGTASFGFELFFNRELEVANGYDPDNVDTVYVGEGIDTRVSRIGVLADILVLDSIIGQGVSADLISAVAQYNALVADAKNAPILEEKARLEAEGKTDEAAALKVDEVSTDTDRAEGLLGVNLGNSAFLNPLPFRVLFSELFMVEGFANAVTVDFQKFSNKMIPTMCRVNINMQALYIGFTKKDTFLTKGLEAVAEEAKKTDSKRKRAGIQLENALNRFSYYQIRAQDWNGATPPTPINPLTIDSVNKVEFNAKLDVDRTEAYANAESANEINESRLTINLYAKFANSENEANQYTVSDLLQVDPYAVSKTNGETTIMLGDATNGVDLRCVDLDEKIKEIIRENVFDQNSVANSTWVAFMFRATLTAEYIDTEASTPEGYSTQIIVLNWSGLDSMNLRALWTKPQTVPSAPPARGVR